MKTMQELRTSISVRKSAVEAHKLLLADTYKSFSKAFRERRKEEGVSLRDAATKIGVSAAYLSDVELGRRNPNEAVLTFFK